MQSNRITTNSSLTVEDFGHEVVAIDLTDGTYFSLKGFAVELWRMIDTDMTVQQMLDKLAESYEMDESALSRVTGFLVNCSQEGMISFDASVVDSVKNFRTEATGSEKLPEFEVEKFSDIQDILLLDPIHDVDDSGWPHTPSDPAK
jgi:hypothetical protein